MTFVPGSMITPHLRLVRLLGQGGMGSVWVADHLTLRTQVAIKFMSAELSANAMAVARFVREASSAAQIKSPHVVQMFDHGVTTEGVPYMVMELLDGEDLGHRIERRGPIGLADTSKILAQAAKALGKAHSLGIVHRDIKPDNLFLVDSEGDIFVKILDFGIAKSPDQDPASKRMTHTGTMVGTPCFMSPEQVVSAKHVDFRTDLWALAVVAYNCLTGTVPFDGETMGALWIAIDRAQFAPPSTRAGALPPAVDAWFARALARDPAARFASAKDMVDAFADVAASARYDPVRAFGSAPTLSAGNTGIAGSTGPGHPQTFAGATVSQTKAPASRAFAVVGVLALALGSVAAVAYVKLSGAPSTASAAIRGDDPIPPPAASATAPIVAPSATAAPIVAPSATADPSATAAPQATAKPARTGPTSGRKERGF